MAVASFVFAGLSRRLAERLGVHLHSLYVQPKAGDREDKLRHTKIRGPRDERVPQGKWFRDERVPHSHAKPKVPTFFYSFKRNPFLFPTQARTSLQRQTRINPSVKWTAASWSAATWAPHGQRLGSHVPASLGCLSLVVSAAPNIFPWESRCILIPPTCNPNFVRASFMATWMLVCRGRWTDGPPRLCCGHWLETSKSSHSFCVAVELAAQFFQQSANVNHEINMRTTARPRRCLRCYYPCTQIKFVK